MSFLGLLPAALPQHPASRQALQSTALPEELTPKKLLIMTWGNPEVTLEPGLTLSNEILRLYKATAVPWLFSLPGARVSQA